MSKAIGMSVVFRFDGNTNPGLIVESAAIHITDVKVIGDRQVLITFNKGTRLLDFNELLDELKGPGYEPLHNQETFSKVEVRDGSLWWPGDLEFDPDDMWDLSVPYKAAAGVK